MTVTRKNHTHDRDEGTTATLVAGGSGGGPSLLEQSEAFGAVARQENDKCEAIDAEQEVRVRINRSGE